MRFPYQRSVGQDLQALFRYERLRAGADTLGQSSIDEGSGALEVRDGAGTAVAIGDLPGGGVGIGIRWQGNLTDLAAVLQDLADEIASGGGGGNNDAWDSRQDRDIARARRRMSENEAGDTIRDQGIAKNGGRLDTKDVEVFALQQQVKRLQERIVELEGETKNLERDVLDNTKGLAWAKGGTNKHMGELLDQRVKTDNLEAMYEDAKAQRLEDRSKIDGLEKVLDDNLLDVDTLWSVASTVQGEVFTARGGRPTLSSRLADMTTSTASAQSTASSAQSAADLANDRITDARGSYSSLGGRLSAITSTANSAQSSADQANDRITSARGSYGSLNLRLDAMTSAASSAQSAASAVQSEVTSARQGAASLNSRITTINGNISQAVSAINACVSAINALRVRVAALDGGPSGPINP